MVHLGDRSSEGRKLDGVGTSPRPVKGEWVCSARVSEGPVTIVTIRGAKTSKCTQETVRRRIVCLKYNKNEVKCQST